MQSLLPYNQLYANWEKYNQLRIAGDKKSANNLLTTFIDLLKQQDEKIINDFVNEFCIAVLDNSHKIISTNGTEVSESALRIQHPLFKEIILPLLKTQYKSNSALHIKWIGQLEQFFYSDIPTTTSFLTELNIAGFFETRFFFERSFSIENNQSTLKLLLNRIAQDINFYLHELPDCVLAEPDVLDQELNTFSKYLQQSNAKTLYDKELLAWELIAKHWRIFNQDKEKYQNFEAYLNSNSIQIN